MKKTFKKLLSVFLSVLIVVQVFPMSAWAKEITQKQAMKNIDTSSVDTNSDEIVIEEEIESLRTENSKTFLTDDNGYYQITSYMPIHNYEDGEWIDKSDVDSSVETVEEAENYVNAQASAALIERATLMTDDSPEDSTISDENEDTNNQVVTSITENGDTHVENCQTAIGTYSSTGTDDLSVIYTRSGRVTKRTEIYVKPYFPTDHAIFVTDAKIKTNIYDTNIIGGYNLVEVNQINSDWSPGIQSEKLNSENSANYDLVDIYSESTDSEELLTYSFDFTNYCNYTRIGLIPNYGVVLTANDLGTELIFESLTVEMYYHEIEDVDSNFEYEQIDMGRAGKVYINDYTCSPVLVRDELSLYGEISPVTIQTVFNPMADISDNGLGLHTRINYYSTLVYYNSSNTYLWKNCEGENLYFTKSRNSSKVFLANGADNVEYKLTVTGSDYSNYNNITINASNNKKYVFNSYNNTGYLTKLYDGSENNNYINIEYANIADGKYNIATVTDGSGRKYEFSYVEGYLSKLSVLDANENPVCISAETNTGEIINTPLEINYNYENGLLKQVTYIDNKTIVYDYGVDEKLDEITNIDNSKVTFEYESKFDGESFKLKNYNTISSNGNINGVKINSIAGSIYNRQFKKTENNIDTDNIKRLSFDHSFNMISMKNYNGIEYFLNYSNNELQYVLTSNEDGDLIENGDFEEVSNGRPVSWQYETTDNSSISQNIVALDDNENNRTMCMDNFMDTCKAYQIVQKDNYTFSAGKSYIISGFIYRNDNPIAISDTRDLCIYVFDTTTDDNGAIIPDSCLTKMDFDDTLGEEWQQRKTIFTTKKDTTSIIVYLSYNNMMYTCDFDNIKLYEATTKNAIEASSIIPSTDVSYDYSENNSILEELKTTVDGDELGTFYNYTDDENYISKITNNGIATYYNYDEDNGLLLSKGKNSDSSKNTQYSYTPVGLLEYVKQVSTQIDGTTVNINTKYSYENDRIKTVEHNGFAYEYNYDSYGRVVGISQYPTTSTQKSQLVSYNYTNDNVDTITYGNGAKILYEFNQFGYITKITYVPSSYNSTIGENNETVANTDLIVYEYTYDEYGNVLSYTDNSNDTVTTIDQNTYTVKEQGENGSVIYQNDGSTKTFFGVKTTFSNPTITTSSGKTTNTRILSLYENKLLPTNVITATTVYDSVGRTFSTTATDKSAVVKNECTYINNGIKTSNLISTYISSVTRTSTSDDEARIYRKLTYNYNDRGQITDVYRASVNNIPENVEGTSNTVSQLKNELLKHYEYDEAGQVILDVNFDSCIAIKYKYNSGGNLISKTIYENENSEDKSAFYYKKSTGKYIFNDEKAEVINYGYSSDWGDVLTSFNGEEISYDEIGNPINYVGQSIAGEDISGTMTWEGNRLMSFDNGQTTYVYKYSADGYRTQKISYDSDNPNNIKTKMDYVYQDDTLVGYKTVTYEYDSGTQTSRPQNEFITSIVYNSTNEAVGLDVTSTNYEYGSNGNTTPTTETGRTYFYLLRDGQGNITDLYNSDESLVLHFSYDAYGICKLSFSGTAIQSLKQQMEGTSEAWKKILMALILSLLYAAAVGGTMLATQQTYRGYVCDYETGLYYNQNRFYSPAWGRFINADDSNIMLNNQENVFNANLFNYCNNDPVNNIDLSGYSPTSYDTANNILSALNITQLNTIQVGVVPSKLKGKVENEMTIFGLSLAIVKDTDDKKYWNRVFGTTENTVQKNNGNNYMDTIVSEQSGSATMYNLKPTTSPYGIGE